ncbi:ribonuclease H [Bifidobacterium sp. DSM 109958]|uniref:ribonuclease H n=1 Tax=Bifidobacterium moraviense TaxID=2675323 RepID=A0A7Y0F1E0_9BIFI|nr:ribonuclease H [Bifidobacterium sp. DSM 109958]NMN00238.1 ribonuclease H [Bifidobacterium sp. DSM 109958]
MTIVVSTDGSALGNPNGPMGWAWADHDRNAGDGGLPGHEHDAHGYDAGGATNGTNQIGELCAVLQALRAHPGPQPLTIETDSQYAINCSTTWVKGWKRNGWKNSQKKPVKNAELIKAIDAEIAKRPGPVRFVWVKGHAGNAGNELVDELARTYAGDCRSGARDGYLPVEGWRSLIRSEYARGLDVPPDVRLVLDGDAPTSSLERPASAEATRATTGPDAVRPRTRARSIADMLAEPEGVPDIAVGSGRGAKTSDASTESDDSDALGLFAAFGEDDPAGGDDVAAADAGSGDEASPVTQQVPVQSVRSDDVEASASRASAAPKHATPSAPVPSASAAGVPASSATAAGGLVASGTVRITPPPSGSPRWAGKDLHITGMIAVDAPIAPDGTIDLANAVFHLTSVRER